MTSVRQLDANRRDALQSTGPRTEDGKRHSRANAFRHGLTAETVVARLEDMEDHKAFEAAVIADYDARTAVERELVLRLASLLWRLRRATSIETDLLNIQAEILGDGRISERARDAEQRPNTSLDCSPPAVRADNGRALSQGSTVDYHFGGPDDQADATRQLTCCFLRLANLDSGVFERLGRYEAALWRQSLQTLLTLQSVRGDRRGADSVSRSTP